MWRKPPNARVLIPVFALTTEGELPNVTNSIILVIAVAKISLSVGLIRTTFNFLHLQEVNFKKNIHT